MPAETWSSRHIRIYNDEKQLKLVLQRLEREERQSLVYQAPVSHSREQTKHEVEGRFDKWKRILTGDG